MIGVNRINKTAALQKLANGWASVLIRWACCIPAVASLEQPADRGFRRQIFRLKFDFVNPE
jgi:hypothetical protein